MGTIHLGPVRTIYFFGGGAVLVTFAQAIREMGLQVKVVTDPRHAAETVEVGVTFEDTIRRNGLPLWVCATLDIRVPPLSEVASDAIGISLGAAWIFSEEVTQLFDGRLLNCHCGYLPMDRGGGGLTWAILRGDRRGLSSLHLVDSGIDTGDIVDARTYIFPENCRIPRDYYAEKEVRDLAFLIDFVRKVRVGCTFQLMPQDNSAATYWPRLDTSLHGAIDWTWNATDVERFICAFDDPYPGAHTLLRGRQVRFKDCRLARSDDVFHPFQTGLVYRLYEQRIYVACVRGNISIGKVLTPDGEDAAKTVTLGDRFWTPAGVLERARLTRVFYTPTGRRVQAADPIVAAYSSSGK